MRVVPQTERTASPVAGSKKLSSLTISQMNKSKMLWSRNHRNLDSRISTVKPVEGISATLNMPLFFLYQEINLRNRGHFCFTKLSRKSSLGIFFFLHFGIPNIPVHCLTMNILLKDCCSKIFFLQGANNPLNWWDK